MYHPNHFAKTNPNKPAIVMAASGEVVTYQQLDQRSNQIAHLFRNLGLKAGDHIALQVENRAEFFEIVWAAQRSGLVFTAISTHLTADETAYIADNSDSKLFITTQRLVHIADKVRIDGGTQVEHFFLLDGEREGFLPLKTQAETCPTTPVPDEEPGMMMLYSSGTTGRPKGVLPIQTATTIDELHPSWMALSQVYGFNEDTVYLSPAPLYHAAPLHWNMLVMKTGGTTVIMEHFDAEQSLAVIEKYQVTHSQWVPIMFIRMLKLEEAIRQRYDVSSMKMAIHASAPCPIETKQKMIDWWGPVINEYYAATEGAGITLIDSAQWLAHRGSVGLPINCIVHITDDDGQELSQGETGTIYFESMVEGDFNYYKDKQKTAEAHHRQGWKTTGDLGYVDAEGYLYLTDRKAFMIISGGVNIYPQEVESTLIQHEDVVDVAVFGIPNEEFGEEVKAVVQKRGGLPANEDAEESKLMAYCREKMSHIKCPRSIDFIEELPRLDNGKLYKKGLQQAYSSSLS